jgi:biopolymer transport protein ExbB/TolQ
MSSAPEEILARRKMALNAALRASASSGAIVHGEMKRGLNSLATIVSLAPWLGLFGMVLGICNSFPALGTEKSTAMAIIFELLSQAFTPCAFGVIVAVVTMWFYKYLLSQLDVLDMEMQNASLQLMNTLSRLRVSN